LLRKWTLVSEQEREAKDGLNETVTNHQWVVTVAKPFRANKQAECDYLFSALRRLEIRGVTENGTDADRVQTYGL
ncbi:hypothetical protein ACW7XM_005383, partial [Escherichia coli]|nr:hypothetical protein [Escherichia coli]